MQISSGSPKFAASLNIQVPALQTLPENVAAELHTWARQGRMMQDQVKIIQDQKDPLKIDVLVTDTEVKATINTSRNGKRELTRKASQPPKSFMEEVVSTAKTFASQLLTFKELRAQEECNLIKAIGNETSQLRTALEEESNFKVHTTKENHNPSSIERWTEIDLGKRELKIFKTTYYPDSCKEKDHQSHGGVVEVSIHEKNQGHFKFAYTADQQKLLKLDFDGLTNTQKPSRYDAFRVGFLHLNEVDLSKKPAYQAATTEAASQIFALIQHLEAQNILPSGPPKTPRPVASRDDIYSRGFL